MLFTEPTPRICPFPITPFTLGLMRFYGTITFKNSLSRLFNKNFKMDCSFSVGFVYSQKKKKRLKALTIFKKEKEKKEIY